MPLSHKSYTLMLLLLYKIHRMNYYRYLLISAFFLCNIYSQDRQEPVIPLISQHNSFFIDTTNTLEPSLIAHIHHEAQKFEQIGFQLAGFCANTTSRNTVDIATEFGNKNGIGYKDKNNGIAFAIFLKKPNARGQKPTIGIAIGKGLEGLLNDAKIGRILDETFVPKRAEGKWQEGLVAFIQKTYRYLENPKAKEFAHIHSQKDLPNNIKGFFIVLLIIIFILWIIKKQGPRKRGPNRMFFINTMYRSGSGFGGGSHGGGGGFGGGGAGR